MTRPDASKAAPARSSGSASGRRRCSSAESVARVRTVLGDVDPSGFGVTLVHEHLVVDWGELTGKPKLRFDFEQGVGQIVERLSAAKADGVGALGECTPVGAGRYV